MADSVSESGGSWTPPSVEELQQLLPQYEIESILGQGGMGAVYKGRQATLARPVAIKVLPELLTEGNDDLKYVERFKLEARAMANLDHPAIVSVYDFGQTEAGQLYFVMEFIDGMDVEQYISSAGGTVDPVHASSIVSHVLDALDYAHSKGIVHRDIKPANVLINQEGRVKIADFGLVKQFAGEEAAQLSALTMENVAMGTPDYIAPEALESGSSPDHRADLYAVGVMLYKMLTGKLPRGLFKMPSEVSDSIDPRFDTIIASAIESTPEGRFQSATEFRHKLDELQSRPISTIDPAQSSGEVPRVVSRTFGTAPAEGAKSGSTDKSPKKAARKPKPVHEEKQAPGMWVGLTALGVFALIGVAAFFLLFPSNEGSNKTGVSATDTSASQPDEPVPTDATSSSKNDDDGKASMPDNSQPVDRAVAEISDGNDVSSAKTSNMEAAVVEDKPSANPPTDPEKVTSSETVSPAENPPATETEAPSTPVPDALENIPGLATRQENFQNARSTQLGELTNKYLGALAASKSDAIQAGSLDRVEIIEKAITEATTYLGKVETLKHQHPPIPLPGLKSFDEEVPENLQRLKSIFTNEASGIESNMFTLFSTSLEQLQGDLVRQEMIGEAKALSRYRERLQSPPSNLVAQKSVSKRDENELPTGNQNGPLNAEKKKINDKEFFAWSGEKVELQLLKEDWTADVIAPILAGIDKYLNTIEDLTGFDTSGEDYERVSIFEMEGANRGSIYMMREDSRAGISEILSSELIAESKETGNVPLPFLHHAVGRIRLEFGDKFDFPHKINNAHVVSVVTDVIKRVGYEESGVQIGSNQTVQQLQDNASRGFPILERSNTSWNEALETGKFEAEDNSFSVRLAYQHMFTTLIEKQGRRDFLRRFFEAAEDLDETKSTQDAINNVYIALQSATDDDISNFLIDEFRMPVSTELR
ncbi:MAG: protein kinase [Verrucomicrobiales bacterium]|nr:protein kinase [Verrucomicrobiales bacterium]